MWLQKVAGASRADAPARDCGKIRRRSGTDAGTDAGLCLFWFFPSAMFAGWPIFAGRFKVGRRRLHGLHHLLKTSSAVVIMVQKYKRQNYTEYCNT